MNTLGETMDKSTRIDLYKRMLWIRLVEEKIAEKYPEEEMRCPVHLSIGQESVAAGVCANLTKEDQALSAHRSHAHYLAKGGDLNGMIAELYGKETGCAQGKGGSMHLVDQEAGLIAAVPIVGSTIPIGVGVAWGLKMKGLDYVTVIFFGDGATEEGAFHESLNFASLMNLKVLFICENNFYSVYTPLDKRQPANRSIADISNGHGVDAKHFDGNDVEEVYKIAKETIEEIKKTSKPKLLEFDTFRWLEHCGAGWDDNLGYRKPGELQHWLEKCPIKKMEERLLKEGIITKEDLDKFRSEYNTKIIHSFEFAKNSKFPEPHLLWEDVYSK